LGRYPSFTVDIRRPTFGETSAGWHLPRNQVSPWSGRRLHPL